MSAYRQDLTGHCARAEAATAELLSQRRRLIAAASLGPVGIMAGTLAPLRARAAGALPSSVRDLDAAALVLFDAAASARWVQARAALARARTAATAAASLGGPFTEAGGALHRYFEARNGLSGDLVEAGLALSVKDHRWLIGVAERIVTRAGELAQPFAERSDKLTPQIETLLFLARRMRRALVWHDSIGYQGARGDFGSLWQAMLPELAPSVPAGRIQALDQALQGATHSPSPSAGKRLDEAVRALRQAN
ncbi:hypothetical protein [uncultured Methylibium sp.]|uniref:hypothetical protein n=1 Tax=uncultured Methylibium sp. TaxID=381093 RepID=UPI0025F8284E|nr:hypothetical protein [uncultured Methylibium sp.]